MTNEDVLTEIKDHIATITLNRPPHNFTDVVTMRTLADTFDSLCENSSVRVAILCSSGRSFSAGADFNKGGVGDPKTTSSDNPLENFRTSTSEFYHEAIRIIKNPLVKIAAVNGAAVGAGLGLALACDFRIGSNRCWFQASFVKLGIHPGFGLSYIVPTLIGHRHATDMFLTGRKIESDEALQFGLLDCITSEDALLGKSMEYANQLASVAPLALQSTRRTLREDINSNIEKVLEHELDEQAKLILTQDAQIGITASLNKTNPQFIGK